MCGFKRRWRCLCWNNKKRNHENEFRRRIYYNHAGYSPFAEKMHFLQVFSSISFLFQGHYDSLWGISTHKTLKSQFMTAGFDGRCILWDSEYHKPVWTK